MFTAQRCFCPPPFPSLLDTLRRGNMSLFTLAVFQRGGSSQTSPQSCLHLDQFILKCSCLLCCVSIYVLKILTLKEKNNTQKTLWDCMHCKAADKERCLGNVWGRRQLPERKRGHGGRNKQPVAQDGVTNKKSGGGGSKKAVELCHQNQKERGISHICLPFA